MAFKPEPDVNPNGGIVDPPAIVRYILKQVMSRIADPKARARKRAKAETARIKAGEPHRIEYFHQPDDPYSHLAAQAAVQLATRYDVELVPHLMGPTGGASQPEAEKLAHWARRDAASIAPHYGLEFPADAPVTPEAHHIDLAVSALEAAEPSEFPVLAAQLGTALWSGDESTLATHAGELRQPPLTSSILERGNARIAELGHYSGAMFHYGGEWFWGADRLFYLEQWLRDLGACKDLSLPFICPRPPIDVSGIDASALTLDFYPSLNSPYTSIIYDPTIAMVKECGIQLQHKPVLPMLMRGLPVPRKKGAYIVFDTKREAEHLGVPFAPLVFPVGEPTRNIYSLFAFARAHDRETDLLSAALRLAFAEGVGLHRKKGLRMAVEQAGLDWEEAQKHLGNSGWQEPTALNQQEMTEGLGLWGVPSYRLRGGEGPDGPYEDLCVWGQDRLWLIAAEIRRRARGMP